MWMIIVPVVIGGLLLLVVANYAASASRRAVTGRLDEIAGMGMEHAAAGADQIILQKRAERFRLIADFFKGKGYYTRIEKQLIAAGLLLKPTEFIIMQFLSFCFLTFIGLVFIHTWYIVLFLMWLGYFAPLFLLGTLMKRRITSLEAQLADALTMISSGLKGGYSFVQGLQMASEQLPPPIADEFTRVLHLIQLGVDGPRALRRMEERVQSYDFSMAVTGVCIQLQTGGNLSELLERVASTIRERIKLRRDINAATAEGKMSGMVLIALPACIAGLLFLINPEYANKLFYTDTGKVLVKIWIGMQTVGILWIRKLLNFDA